MEAKKEVYNYLLRDLPEDLRDKAESWSRRNKAILKPRELRGIKGAIVYALEQLTK